MFRYTLRKNDRAKVILEKHVSGGLGSRVHITYWIYDRLAKEAYGPYFTRKDAEKEYKDSVKFNLYLLSKKKKKSRSRKSRKKRKKR